MLLTLSVISAQGADLGQDAYKVFDATGGSIGRVEGNNWILPDPEKVVSGRHARVFLHGGAFYLEDLSTNGTFLNSTSVAVDRSRPAELRDGDRLHIGDYEILVQIIEEAPVDAAFAEPAPVPVPVSVPEAAVPHPAQEAAFAPWEGPANEAAPPFAEAPPPESGNPAARSAGVPPRAFATPPVSEPAPGVDDSLDPLAALGLPARSPSPPTAPGPPRSPVPPPAPVRAAAPAASAATGEIPLNWDATSFNVNRSPPLAAARARPEPPPARPRSPAGAPAASPPATPGAPSPRAAPPPLPGVAAGLQSAEAVRPAPIFQPPPIPNTPPSAPPPAHAGEAAIAAFCAELGLDASQLDANAARQMGIIVRIVVQGMLGVLQARTEVKNNFRMPLTSMRPVENNPLKFSMNAEHAVHNLFVNRNPGYLPAAEAFQEAFEDVEIHQMAMLVGIRAAFNAMLARLTPDRLEETYERRLKRTSLLGVTMKSKYWELYREYFEDLARDPEATFQNLFGEEFAKAYHAQMQSLATAGRNRSR